MLKRSWPVLLVLALVLLPGSGLQAAGVPAHETRPFAAPQKTEIINFPNGGFTYDPADVRISVGDAVQWVGSGAPFGDFVSHPLVSDEGLWPVQSTGTTFTFTFTKAGVYHYHCQIHGQLGMTGTVLVVGNIRTALPLIVR